MHQSKLHQISNRKYHTINKQKNIQQHIHHYNNNTNITNITNINNKHKYKHNNNNNDNIDQHYLHKYNNDYDEQYANNKILNNSKYSKGIQYQYGYANNHNNNNNNNITNNNNNNKNIQIDMDMMDMNINIDSNGITELDKNKVKIGDRKYQRKPNNKNRVKQDITNINNQQHNIKISLHNITQNKQNNKYNANMRHNSNPKSISNLTNQSNNKIQNNNNKKPSNQYKARSVKCISQTLFNTLSKQYQYQHQYYPQIKQKVQTDRILNNICNSTAQTPFVYLKMYKMKNRINRKINSLIKLQINQEGNGSQIIHNTHNNRSIRRNHNNCQQNYIKITQPIKLSFLNNNQDQQNYKQMLSSNSNANNTHNHNNTNRNWMKNRNYKSSHSPSRSGIKCFKHGLIKQQNQQTNQRQCVCCKKQKKIKVQSQKKKDYLRPWSGMFLVQGENF